MAFTHAEVEPIVADLIKQIHSKTKHFVMHEELVGALLKHPAGKQIIEAALRSRSKAGWSRENWAANMKAWFSQRYPHSEYRDRFERQKVGGRWAYKPRAGRKRGNRADRDRSVEGRIFSSSPVSNSARA